MNKTYAIEQTMTGLWLVEEINRDTGAVLTSACYGTKQAAFDAISSATPNRNGRSLRSSINSPL